MDCIELKPGSTLFKPISDLEAEMRRIEEVNRQAEVKRYKLNPDGTIGEFLGVMPAFPEGWDDPLKLKEKRIQKENGGADAMPKGGRIESRNDKEKILEAVKQAQKEGKNVSQIAKELGVPDSTLYGWLHKAKRKQQAQEPEPAQVSSQEPEQEQVSTEPADKAILSQQIDELRYDLDLERQKVAQLEKQVAELKQKNLTLWAEASIEKLKNHSIPIMAQLIVAVARILEANQDA